MDTDENVSDSKSIFLYKFNMHLVNMSYNNIRYTVHKQRETSSGRPPVANSQTSIQQILVNGSKEFKIKTEILISHSLAKSKGISAEILDTLEFEPKSPRRRGNNYPKIYTNEFIS